MRPKLAAAAVGLACLLLAGSASAQPDLDLAWWTVNTSSVQGYQSQITVNFGVSNGIVSSPAGPFYVAFYYGDSTGTTGLTYLGRTYVPSLGTGTTAFYTQTVTMPATVLYGGRYLHYYVDYSGMVTETNENNNRGSRSITITGRPDIQVSTLGVSPTTAAPGSTLNVSYRFYNAGYSRVPAAFATRFYYSTNSSINTADTYLNRQITTASLLARSYAPGGGNGTTTVTVPAGATLGTRYIGAIADYNAQITESNANNNTRAAAFTVAYPAELKLQAWSTNVSSVPGYTSQVQISFSVTNSGGAAGPFVVRFYYGNSSATTGLTQLASRSISGLAAGATTATLTQTVTLPASVLYGTRYLHYFVDATAQVAESNEGNNRGNRTLGITSRPDLRVTTLTVAPTTASPGATLNLTYRLYNAGYSRVAGTYYTRFYYSTDSVISAADTYLNRQISTANLLARSYMPGSGTGSTTATVPSGATPGTRYIGAFTDYSNVVTESIETNNTRAAALTVTSGGGVTCTSGGQCASGHCVDGVCCNSACGGGVTSDCRACSTAAGGSTNGTCTLLPSTRVCRLAAGICDQAESCTGASAACPPNGYKSTTTVCRTAAGTCDLAETCSGSSAAYPTDSFKPTTTVCRAAAGVCDLAETCTGAASCPKDVLKPNGTPCAGGACAAGVCKPSPVDLGAPDSAADAGSDGSAEQGVDLTTDLATDLAADLGGDAANTDGVLEAALTDTAASLDGQQTQDDSSSTTELGTSESGPPQADAFVPNFGPDSDGCSCRLDAGSDHPIWPGILLALILLVLPLRRRRPPRV